MKISIDQRIKNIADRIHSAKYKNSIIEKIKEELKSEGFNDSNISLLIMAGQILYEGRISDMAMISSRKPFKFKLPIK